AELISFTDANQPCVIFGLGNAQRDQFLQHDSDLDPVGCGQGIQLQRVLASGQLTLVGRAGNRTIDVGKFAAIILVPGPDSGWCVGVVTHSVLPCSFQRDARRRRMTWEDTSPGGRHWPPQSPNQALRISPSSRKIRLFRGLIQASPPCTKPSSRKRLRDISACTVWLLLSVCSSSRTRGPITDTRSIRACRLAALAPG